MSIPLNPTMPTTQLPCLTSTNAARSPISPQTPSKPKIILFRTPTEPLSEDAYVLHLSSRFAVECVPVLRDELVGQVELERIVEGGGERWESVIMTSRRAAEAWVAASGVLSNASE
jgi:hypothetical protein